MALWEYLHCAHNSFSKHPAWESVLEAFNISAQTLNPCRYHSIDEQQIQLISVEEYLKPTLYQPGS
ncbi:hypothetical protein GNF10_29535 [Nostoc sp. UCD121]|uniref:hypothetical protein n=1 Tax=unclassified Nostoc TaxID=2593658 RepID=UPI0016287678|nr:MULTISPECIES: hypothetical protein [unclassified Nostoc]MBC1219766.1 hypothetical protein [Nostoc sp. UCD120]MBC1279980.1 hypothetical protein [Nostoc sp. UCD121]MBC1297046.1 hypothetical protein [Nostoc sp. UCD122]